MQSASADLADHPIPPRGTIGSGLLQDVRRLASANTLLTPPHAQVKPGFIDTPQAVNDGTQQPRNRATGRATAAREWKRARAHDLLSDSDEDGEEGSDDQFSDPYGDETSGDADLPGTQFPSRPAQAKAQSGAPETESTRDAKDTLAFDPDNLRHPRSAKWEPAEHIAQYLALRVRKSLSQEGRNKLRAECPRPNIPDAVAKNPEVKTGWKPKTGLDYSLRNCHDKFLDTLDPVTKL
ncbi:Hypothetical predicted protein [Pelobates cultripes]|uniref:Uncharacterized protein n=1 Tax=Pelobates cultripes TaxID=61616 RepID=A0AAD1WEV0_PELCU|nr:Hypothetical predicted protein [Pelobates cultripes]